MANAAHAPLGAEQTPERPETRNDPSKPPGGSPATHHEAASRPAHVKLFHHLLYGWAASEPVAKQLLDAYRAEVVAERDAEIMCWLGKKAREYRATGSQQHALQADTIDLLASKISRGAVRPDNTRLPSGIEPRFFEPGRTYQFTVTSPSLLVTTWTFKVTSVGPPPDGGRPVAFGWRRENDEPWEPSDADDFTGWTEVTEGGDAR